MKDAKTTKTAAGSIGALGALFLNDTYGLDIAFLLDATGSMAHAIEGVKDHIQKTVSGVQEQYPQCSVRVGVVAYRDFDIIEPPSGVETLDFTSDIEAFKMFLSNLRARGGDDEAEDVFSGLKKCTKLSWEANARAVIHIADAACHGQLFHTNRVHDKYPNIDPNGSETMEVLTNLLSEDACNVNTYQFFHLNRSTKPMIEKFKELVKNKASSFLEDDLESNEEMPERFIHSSLHSIHRSSGAAPRRVRNPFSGHPPSDLDDAHEMGPMDLGVPTPFVSRYDPPIASPPSSHAIPTTTLDS